MFTFSSDSPFVLEDNRRDRVRLPTSATSLNTRFQALLPELIVKGSTVLDVGCCIGAAGEWCLQHGAVSYTGVEVQELYSMKARELLQPWSRKASIVREIPQENFDVVILMGVLHCVFDPIEMLRNAADRAQRYLIVEDFGLRTRHLLPKLNDTMTLAGESTNRVGFGWIIGDEAIKTILNYLGFAAKGSQHKVSHERWGQIFVRTNKPFVDGYVSWKK